MLRHTTVHECHTNQHDKHYTSSSGVLTQHHREQVLWHATESAESAIIFVSFWHRWRQYLHKPPTAISKWLMLCTTPHNSHQQRRLHFYKHSTNSKKLCHEGVLLWVNLIDSRFRLGPVGTAGVFKALLYSLYWVTWIDIKQITLPKNAPFLLLKLWQRHCELKTWGSTWYTSGIRGACRGTITLKWRA